MKVYMVLIKRADGPVFHLSLHKSQEETTKSFNEIKQLVVDDMEKGVNQYWVLLSFDYIDGMGDPCVLSEFSTGSPIPSQQ